MSRYTFREHNTFRERTSLAGVALIIVDATVAPVDQRVFEDIYQHIFLKADGMFADPDVRFSANDIGVVYQYVGEDSIDSGDEPIVHEIWTGIYSRQYDSLQLSNHARKVQLQKEMMTVDTGLRSTTYTRAYTSDAAGEVVATWVVTEQTARREYSLGSALPTTPKKALERIVRLSTDLKETKVPALVIIAEHVQSLIAVLRDPRRAVSALSTYCDLKAATSAYLMIQHRMSFDGLLLPPHMWSDNDNDPEKIAQEERGLKLDLYRALAKFVIATAGRARLEQAYEQIGLDPSHEAYVI